MTEYMPPKPYWARNDNEMARLRAEAAELRTFLEAEETGGRDLLPGAMNAKARLRTVEREISMAESAERHAAAARPVTMSHDPLVGLDAGCGRLRRVTQARRLVVPAELEAARCMAEKAVAANALEPRFMPPRPPGR